VLAFGGELSLDGVHCFPRAIGHWYPGIGFQQVCPDAFVLGCPRNRERLGEDGIADGYHAMRDLLMPGLIYLTPQDPNEGTGVDEVFH
jgi:hypothetical protein